MDEVEQITRLKQLLRKEVRFFCRHARLPWKEPVEETIRELRFASWPAVLFGGTLRSLLVSRLTDGRPGRPRDVDIVVKDMDLSQIRKQFEPFLVRETRFGGLQLRRMNWQLDVWPLDRTWAFVQQETTAPDFEDLPGTTFFNLESIAVEAWSTCGRARRIYSGDDQFFKGILARVLEVNLQANPFPELCVLRGLVLAKCLNYRVGPRLARYIEEFGKSMSCNRFEEVQIKHYGKVRFRGELLVSWVRHVAERLSSDDQGPVRLPTTKQLTFWPVDDCDPGGTLAFQFGSRVCGAETEVLSNYSK
jgi:hypothetical protein